MTLERAPHLLLISAALLCCAPALADSDLPYLSSISIERASVDDTAFAASTRSILHVNDPERSAISLSGVDGLEIVATDEDTISIEFVARPTVSGNAEEKFRHSTFVVDFDEESVRSLSSDLGERLGQAPSLLELVTFVHEHIDNKSYSRSFDLASRVAETREGDCTEHAVLLAALARANGYYARVTFGTLILDSDAGLYAFGHAWAEIHDGENWQIGDATMPESDPALRQLRYLPVAILKDEGPGYFLSLIEAMSSMPARITGMANSD